MKIRYSLIAIALLLSIGSLVGCRKNGCMSVNSCNYDPDAKKDDGTCIDKGQVTFWSTASGNSYDIAVTINATESSITTHLIDTPICDASGCANFSLCPGSHNYTAHEVFPGTGSWTGNVVSLESGCTIILLE